ncbi:MAG: hypothetical protein JSS38_11215 [Nitrospira sp.]|nr:hypothetical protein [Nitrospira sp.]
MFLVDPDNRKLANDLPPLKTGNNIKAGEHFSVSLDAGFLRYIQAVDPYVIVYSESWMGKKPRPAEGEKTLRRIVLIKEGMAPNARLAVTSFPLLGPVTMGEDLLDVYVTLKVVVLSKHDNQQTIQLVEGLASTASTAAPQYAPIAGAAAATIAAFISQNRDKVEFEHTFVFSPDGFAEDGISSTPHTSETTLREGRLVVLKGESRFRSIPYPNWYYYLWPFNWFGLSPDGPSRRFEVDDTPNYTLVGEIVRLGPSAVGSLFSDAASDASFPWKWFVTSSPPTDPSRLAVDGYHLIKCVDQHNLFVPSHLQSSEPLGGFFSWVGGKFKSESNSPTAETNYITRLRERYGVKEGEDICKLRPTYPLAGDQNFFTKWIYRIFSLGQRPTVQSTNLYSEKTHMILGIRKAKGTLGTFETMGDLFAEHATLIDEVTTTSSEANKISNERIKTAFESAKQAALFERSKRQIREEVKHRVLDPADIPGKELITNEEDRKTLDRLAIQENVQYAKATIIDYAKNIKDKEGEEFFRAMIDFVELTRKSWAPKFPGANNEWIDAWKQVVNNVRGFLMQNADFRKSYLLHAADWENLKDGDCLGSREKPAVSIADVTTVRGPQGKRIVRLNTRVSPKVNEPFTLKYLAVNGTAILDTDFEQIAPATQTFGKDDKNRTSNITIKSTGINEGDKDFFATIELDPGDKEKAHVCKARSRITIRDGVGPVAALTVDPVLRKETKDGNSYYLLTFKTDQQVQDPIRFRYQWQFAPTANANAYTIEPKEFIIEPYALSTEHKIPFPGENQKVLWIQFLANEVFNNAKPSASMFKSEYKDSN